MNLATRGQREPGDGINATYLAFTFLFLFSCIFVILYSRPEKYYKVLKSNDTAAKLPTSLCGRFVRSSSWCTERRWHSSP